MFYVTDDAIYLAEYDSEVDGFHEVSVDFTEDRGMHTVLKTGRVLPTKPKSRGVFSLVEVMACFPHLCNRPAVELDAEAVVEPAKRIRRKAE